jgi:hypothetical protein
MPHSGDEIRPPWLEYPGSEPTWSGWRQGLSEAWLLSVWLPFWRGLTDNDRSRYLQRWPPPDEAWEVTLTKHWT